MNVEVDSTENSITAIVPARNEEAVITGCLQSLAQQPQVERILVVDDESTDATAAVVRDLATRIAHVELFSAGPLPEGWAGKNHALAVGSRLAVTAWLLFVDADVTLEPGATARALEIARESNAALVSFSPEQVTKNWYERALIPFVYCRLSRRFSFERVNDPNSQAAAANGQFLMIRRDVYQAIGGHQSVAGEVLEDVALALAVKRAGHAIWFGAGKGLVRARMYRSFAAMWEGWKKNIYRLVGGTPWAAFRESESALPWIPLVVILLGFKFPLAVFLGVLLLTFRQVNYGAELVRNQYPRSFIIYYIPAVFLYVGVLAASWRSHTGGKVQWKGREYRTN